MKNYTLLAMALFVAIPSLHAMSPQQRAALLRQDEANRKQIKKNIQAIDKAKDPQQVKMLYEETQELINKTSRGQKEFANVLINATADAKKRISVLEADKASEPILPPIIIEAEKRSITPPPSPEPHKRARVAPPVPTQLPPALRSLPSVLKQPAPAVPSQLPLEMLPAPAVPTQLPAEMQEDVNIEESIEEINMPEESAAPSAQPFLLEQIRQGKQLKKVGAPQRRKIKPAVQKQFEEQMEKRQQQIDALNKRLKEQEKENYDNDSEWED